MTEATDAEVIRAMIQNGGSFVKALGEAAARADADNLWKIKTAFSKYWHHYEKIAVQSRDRTNLDNAPQS